MSNWWGWGREEAFKDRKRPCLASHLPQWYFFWSPKKNRRVKLDVLIYCVQLHFCSCNKSFVIKWESPSSSLSYLWTKGRKKCEDKDNIYMGKGIYFFLKLAFSGWKWNDGRMAFKGFKPFILSVLLMQCNQTLASGGIWTGFQH